MTASHRRARGWSLMHMLVLITMVGAFMAASGRLFIASTVATREARKTQQRQAQFDHVMRQMRKDVWNAQSIEATENGAVLRIAQPDAVVTWVMNDEPDEPALIRAEEVTAKEKTDLRRWDKPGWRVRFSTATGVVTVTVQPVDNDHVDTVTLVSQLQLATGQR